MELMQDTTEAKRCDDTEKNQKDTEKAQREEKGMAGSPALDASCCGDALLTLPKISEVLPSASATGAGNPAATCMVCDKEFPSRSQLFKHLKCGCGVRTVDSAGGPLNTSSKQAPPPTARGKTAERGSQIKRAPAKARRSISQSAATLWFGDIPYHIASAKRIGEILYLSKPHAMPTPFVKTVVKKGYRAGSRREGIEDRQLECLQERGGGGQGESGSTRKQSTCADDQPSEYLEERGAGRKLGEWLGYAFVVFRDEVEAGEAKTAFDGVLLADGWVPRILPAEDRRKSPAIKEGRGCQRLAPGEDPSLGHQLLPPTLRPHERVAAVARHRRAAGCVTANV